VVEAIDATDLDRLLRQCGRSDVSYRCKSGHDSPPWTINCGADGSLIRRLCLHCRYLLPAQTAVWQTTG
jgi:hypothetical protein